MFETRCSPWRRASSRGPTPVAVRSVAAAIVLVFAVAPVCGPLLAQSSCAPGWTGQTLIDSETLAPWSTETDTGASLSLGLVPGREGSALQMSWDLGSGSWVQARHAFATPVDLSAVDVVGVDLRGGSTTDTPNTVALMFADANGVFYGHDIVGRTRAVHQMDRWLINLVVPRKLFRFFFSTSGGGSQIDWTQVNRFFLVVKRPEAGLGGGTGTLLLDRVRVDTAAAWPRGTSFETPTPAPLAATRAFDYLLSQQDLGTGLFVSWKEEETQNPPPKSWLYDQALVLLVLAREGQWKLGSPANDAARAARRLASFLVLVQKPDGHWARGWHTRTGAELVDDGWVGDQGWCVMALAAYADAAGDAAARLGARRGADWLAARIDPQGKVVPSTEGNVDVWWALMSLGRLADADRIRNYLLAPGTVWDAQLQYWWRGFEDPVVAMDAATWLSMFARHARVLRPERGAAALAFVRRTLVTRSDDGNLCGLDGQGPVSVWNEGVAQYVSAGGPDADAFLATLLAQQRPDGSMPGSPDDHATDAFGWLTSWSGLAPTAWLYFALTEPPFPLEFAR